LLISFSVTLFIAIELLACVRNSDKGLKGVMVSFLRHSFFKW